MEENNHIEKRREQKRRSNQKYRENNKEKIKEYYKEYTSNNREYFSKRTKAWRDSNPDKIKEYYENNREKMKEKDRKRRARKLNVISEVYTTIEIIERDNHTCQICFIIIPNLPMSESNNPLYLNIDHIVALWAGGSDTKENVRAVHRICNISRTKHEEQEGI